MLDILCPVDFTAASDAAISAATAIASRLDSGITLLHVMDTGTAKDAALVSSTETRLATLAPSLNTRAGVRHLLRTGDFLKEITREAADGHALIVAGTHGIRGLRQSIFGADMLRLVRKQKIPSLVVQEGASPLAGLRRIVMPVAGHADITPLLDAVSMLAKAFACEVHVFQLMRPGEEASDQLLNNKLVMMRRMEGDGIACREVNEPSTTFSVGFAEQTASYAERAGAGCIAIMAGASDEYRYIADAEKERMLMNSAHIPVLCAT